MGGRGREDSERASERVNERTRKRDRDREYVNTCASQVILFKSRSEILIAPGGGCDTIVITSVARHALPWKKNGAGNER